jgi:hypothetical protein
MLIDRDPEPQAAFGDERLSRRSRVESDRRSNIGLIAAQARGLNGIVTVDGPRASGGRRRSPPRGRSIGPARLPKK